MKDPSAALLIIGAEILSGKVDDANGPFLLRALRARGVAVQEVRTIGDDVATIAAALDALRRQVTWVLSSGGIGPTHDDVTVAGLAAAGGVAVVHHPALLHRLQQRYGTPLGEAHQKMAEVPQGAEVVLGDGSHVPVVVQDNVLLLPGVPALLRGCFAAVADRFAGAPFYSASLLLQSPETAIAATLSAAQQRFYEVAIGSYPRLDVTPVQVRVTLDGRLADPVQKCLAYLQENLPTAAILDSRGPSHG